MVCEKCGYYLNSKNEMNGILWKIKWIMQHVLEMCYIPRCLTLYNEFLGVFCTFVYVCECQSSKG